MRGKGECKAVLYSCWYRVWLLLLLLSPALADGEVQTDLTYGQNLPLDITDWDLLADTDLGLSLDTILLNLLAETDKGENYRQNTNTPVIWRENEWPLSNPRQIQNKRKSYPVRQIIQKIVCTTRKRLKMPAKTKRRKLGLSRKKLLVSKPRQIQDTRISQSVRKIREKKICKTRKRLKRPAKTKKRKVGLSTNELLVSKPREIQNKRKSYPALRIRRKIKHETRNHKFPAKNENRKKRVTRSAEIGIYGRRLDSKIDRDSSDRDDGRLDRHREPWDKIHETDRDGEESDGVQIYRDRIYEVDRYEKMDRTGEMIDRDGVQRNRDKNYEVDRYGEVDRIGETIDRIPVDRDRETIDRSVGRFGEKLDRIGSVSLDSRQGRSHTIDRHLDRFRDSLDIIHGGFDSHGEKLDGHRETLDRNKGKINSESIDSHRFYEDLARQGVILDRFPGVIDGTTEIDGTSDSWRRGKADSETDGKIREIDERDMKNRWGRDRGNAREGRQRGERQGRDRKIDRQTDGLQTDIKTQTKDAEVKETRLVNLEDVDDLEAQDSITAPIYVTIVQRNTEADYYLDKNHPYPPPEPYPPHEPSYPPPEPSYHPEPYGPPKPYPPEPYGPPKSYEPSYPEHPHPPIYPPLHPHPPKYPSHPPPPYHHENHYQHTVVDNKYYHASDPHEPSYHKPPFYNEDIYGKEFLPPPLPPPLPLPKYTKDESYDPPVYHPKPEHKYHDHPAHPGHPAPYHPATQYYHDYQHHQVHYINPHPPPHPLPHPPPPHYHDPYDRKDGPILHPTLLPFAEPIEEVKHEYKKGSRSFEHSVSHLARIQVDSEGLYKDTPPHGFIKAKYEPPVYHPEPHYPPPPPHHRYKDSSIPKPLPPPPNFPSDTPAYRDTPFPSPLPSLEDVDLSYHRNKDPSIPKPLPPPPNFPSDSPAYRDTPFPPPLPSLDVDPSYHRNKDPSIPRPLPPPPDFPSDPPAYRDTPLPPPLPSLEDVDPIIFEPLIPLLDYDKTKNPVRPDLKSRPHATFLPRETAFTLKPEKRPYTTIKTRGYSRGTQFKPEKHTYATKIPVLSRPHSYPKSKGSYRPYASNLTTLNPVSVKSQTYADKIHYRPTIATSTPSSPSLPHTYPSTFTAEEDEESPKSGLISAPTASTYKIPATPEPTTAIRATPMQTTQPSPQLISISLVPPAEEPRPTELSTDVETLTELRLRYIPTTLTPVHTFDSNDNEEIDFIRDSLTDIPKLVTTTELEPETIDTIEQPDQVEPTRPTSRERLQTVRVVNGTEITTTTKELPTKKSISSKDLFEIFYTNHKQNPAPISPNSIQQGDRDKLARFFLQDIKDSDVDRVNSILDSNNRQSDGKTQQNTQRQNTQTYTEILLIEDEPVFPPKLPSPPVPEGGFRPLFVPSELITENMTIRNKKMYGEQNPSGSLRQSMHGQNMYESSYSTYSLDENSQNMYGSNRLNMYGSGGNGPDMYGNGRNSQNVNVNGRERPNINVNGRNRPNVNENGRNTRNTDVNVNGRNRPNVNENGRNTRNTDVNGRNKKNVNGNGRNNQNTNGNGVNTPNINGNGRNRPNVNGNGRNIQNISGNGRNNLNTNGNGVNRPNINGNGRNRPNINGNGRNRLNVNENGRNRPNVNENGRNRPNVNENGSNRPNINGNGRNNQNTNGNGSDRPNVNENGRKRLNINESGRNRPNINGNGRNRNEVSQSKNGGNQNIPDSPNTNKPKTITPETNKRPNTSRPQTNTSTLRSNANDKTEPPDISSDLPKTEFIRQTQSPLPEQSKIRVIMRISVNTETDTIPLEVADDLELENFKALCEMEVGIPVGEMVVVFNAQPLTDNKKSLRDYGVQDGELVMIMRAGTLLRRVMERGRQQQQSQNSPGIGQIDFGGIRLPGIQAPSAPPAPALGDNGNGSSGGNNSGGNAGTVGGEGNEDGDFGVLGLAGSSSGDDPAVIRDMLLANPEQLALLRHNNPKLAEALTSGDLETFASVLREQQERRRDREQQRIRLLTADPFDMEAQQLIAKEIQQENINANMEAAMEYNPESFGTVHMLYINCKVNGHDVKAFIDSGAQTTIMSEACAERCNIMRLVDTRWAGIAKGVGTQRIIGRVHMGQIQIEQNFLASSFSILEEQPMDMLLGLDMLKRHQMCIDLKNNKLNIGTTGTSTPFLNESELPECARLTAISEEEMRRQSEAAAKESEDRALAQALSASAKESSASGSDASTSKDEKKSEEAAAAGDSSSNPAPTDNFSDSDIQEIMQIGFTRVQAIDELRRQNGNKTQAIAALFAKSLKM